MRFAPSGLSCVLPLSSRGIACPEYWGVFGHETSSSPFSRSSGLLLFPERLRIGEGGGTPDSATAVAEPAGGETIPIPGPLRSFLRMAGISQEAPPEDVLPLLARNVSLHGYQNGGETEFLVLLRRYVDFARELRQLAGAEGVIRVENCDDAERLVDVLGYQFAEGCGEKNGYVVTANAERAFLAIDSGFPLTALEEALQKHKTFEYAFPATPVPVIFHEQDWTGMTISRQKSGTNLLDALLRDRQLDILYWALSKNDEETRNALRQRQGLKWMLAIAPALDFYGSQLSIREGHVLVPGGAQADHAWQELAGANPSSPEDFIEHCTRGIADGWGRILTLLLAWAARSRFI